MSDCCDQWRPLVSDQRPCPWTPLVFPLLIRVLARLSYFCLGRIQSFCWSRRLADYLYNNSSELSFDASVYITNSLERSGYASMIFWLFHLNRFKSLLIDVIFVSSEGWLWGVCKQPFVLQMLKIPCLAYLDGFLTLSWRGSKDHPDMRIHILSLAWNISGAIDAHSHQHFVIAKLHMADVLRLVVVAYWEPLGYLQYSSSCRKLIRLSYYSFVQLMKVSKEYFCSFLILGLLACLGLRMMEMYS